MPSILESLQSLLSEGDTMAKLGSFIGADADDTETALDAAGPALLGGLAKRSAADDGTEALGRLLDDADPTLVDDIDGFVERGRVDAGGGILSTLFGNDRSRLVAGLAEQTGLDSARFSKLLPMLAPIFLSNLATLRSDDDTDVEAMVGRLSDERDELTDSGKIGGWLAGLLGAGAVGAAAAAVTGKLGDAKDAVVDRVDDAADDAADDAEGAAEDAADDVADDAAAEDAADDDAGAATGATAAAAVTATGDRPVVDDRRRGLGWLWWALAAVLLVLFLAFLLNQCSNSDDDDGGTSADAGTTAVSADDAATDDGADEDGGSADQAMSEADLQAEVDAVLGGGVTGVVDGDTVTLTGTVTTEQAKAAAEAAVLGVEEVASVDNQIEVSADDGGEAAGDLQGLVDDALGDGVTGVVDGDTVTLTGTVSTEEAKAAAEAAVLGVEGVASVDNQIEVSADDGGEAAGDLQGLVDDALGDGVTGVVDGDTVTLTGTVTTEEAKAAAEAAVLGVEGVASVDNQIEVSADGGGDSAGGETLNDQLGLDPITFEYRSAQITADGETVLAEVIAYLEANEEVSVEIQGHTDSDGTEAENIELSTRRAESVQAYLVDNGIDAGRMTAVGLGESSPKVDNDTAANKAINRRIEFIPQP